MKKVVNFNLTYHYFEGLEAYPKLRHGVFARGGPKGRDMTFSYSKDVNPEQIYENFRLAEAALGLGPSSPIGQVHGRDILELKRGQIYQPSSPSEILSGYDAIIGFPNQALALRLGDCQGIMLFDPKQNLLALVHSGWRGTVQNILGHTIERLINYYSCDPQALIARGAPSLGPCCAEYKNYQSEFPPHLWSFGRKEDFLFDFPSISLSQLTRAGLKEENIDLKAPCTRCSPDFYSHRRGETHRFLLLCGVVE
ncbi:MAG: polyphenol oxidase family protein [Deltaproteobacteria bacterium]|jgi:YfiH family protein|nr:polyphenol oxidase family protein [Deltaproteobacteria bacterium]